MNFEKGKEMIDELIAKSKEFENPLFVIKAQGMCEVLLTMFEDTHILTEDELDYLRKKTFECLMLSLRTLMKTEKEI